MKYTNRFLLLFFLLMFFSLKYDCFTSENNDGDGEEGDKDFIKHCKMLEVNMDEKEKSYDISKIINHIGGGTGKNKFLVFMLQSIYTGIFGYKILKRSKIGFCIYTCNLPFYYLKFAHCGFSYKILNKVHLIIVGFNFWRFLINGIGIQIFGISIKKGAGEMGIGNECVKYYTKYCFFSYKKNDGNENNLNNINNTNNNNIGNNDNNNDNNLNGREDAQESIFTKALWFFFLRSIDFISINIYLFRFYSLNINFCDLIIDLLNDKFKKPRLIKYFRCIKEEGSL